MIIKHLLKVPALLLVLLGATTLVQGDDKALKGEPKAMDITGTEGPNVGRTILAIYERNGDVLRVCYDLAGKTRPTEFETEDGKFYSFELTKKK